MIAYPVVMQRRTQQRIPLGHTNTTDGTWHNLSNGNSRRRSAIIANHWKEERSRNPSSESSLPTNDISVRIDNFASNLFAGLIAYDLLPKKPESMESAFFGLGVLAWAKGEGLLNVAADEVVHADV